VGGVGYDLSLSNSSATYDFANTTVSGMNPTLNTSIAIDNQKFSNCGLINGGGGTYTNLNIQGSTSTTSAMTISSGSNLTGSSFTKGTENYAVEMTDAGSYDLSDCTFTGYTTDLNVTASTGELTITIALGQSPPSFTTAGATVTFVTPSLSANIAGIVDGSRLQVYNVTSATEIANEVISGTTWSLSYDEGVEFTTGDVVRIRLAYQSGVTAKTEFQTTTVATASGWTALADQQDNDVYVGYGIDGSTQTSLFTADYVDDEVDVILASNFGANQFYSWWVYNTTTEDGIRNFFGGVTAEDAANLRINTSILSLMFDKLTTSNVYQNDNVRIYRDDAAYPVKNPTTGGGAIDIVWREKVFIANLSQIWNEDLVAGSYTGGSAGNIIRNIPRVITKNKEL
jgi:hypothetical protein